MWKVLTICFFIQAQSLNWSLLKPGFKSVWQRHAKEKQKIQKEGQQQKGDVWQRHATETLQLQYRSAQREVSIAQEVVAKAMKTLTSIKITGKKSDEQKKKKAKQELDAATKKLHIAMDKRLAVEEKMDGPGADA